MKANKLFGKVKRYFAGRSDTLPRGAAEAGEPWTAMLESLPAVFYHRRADGKIAYVTPGTVVLCGFQPEAFTGNGDFWAGRLHPDDYARVFAAFEQLSGQDRQVLEYRWRIADGSYRRFLDSMRLVGSADGAHDEIVGIWQEIGEVIRTEEQLRQRNKECSGKTSAPPQQWPDARDEVLRREKHALLARIAGCVGHELRNPLGVISNAVYYLKAVLPATDSTTQEYLDIIGDEIGNAERIASDLLDAVRTKPPHIETVNAAEVLDLALRKCRVPASVTVERDIPAALPPLRVDPLQMQQVFRNLINNGIEAMPDGGVLHISAAADLAAGVVRIGVRDSGAGIAPEHRDKLFQPLFTTKARAIGLGLAVVKNLSLANGGQVDVQSMPGEGATFTVTLPIDLPVNCEQAAS